MAINSEVNFFFLIEVEKLVKNLLLKFFMLAMKRTWNNETYKEPCITFPRFYTKWKSFYRALLTKNLHNSKYLQGYNCRKKSQNISIIVLSIKLQGSTIIFSKIGFV